MYKVLYRKWRPQTFNDVVGQDHITATLTNEVKENRLAHAYLFTGSRGTGKTSCAKILSKAINCLNPQNGNPCCKCDICLGIDNGSVMDVIEIDAASNRGIEDIKAIRDESAFSPAQATYRVYIIDEVHMLTIEAFNALLKTLEEPPMHVKFILATTEVQKLPSTILSRCQRFDFRRISSEDIAGRLKYVCSNEDITITDEGAMLIARISDGGMRDALSLLDRCISISSNVTSAVVTDAAGIMSSSYLKKMAEAFAQRNSSQALNIIDELHKSSCDSERLLTELTNYFRNVLMVKTVKEPEKLVICTDEEMEDLKYISSLFKNDEIFYILDVLVETTANVKKTQNKRIESEIAVIKICSPKTSDDTSALFSRIDSLEKEFEALKSSGFTPTNSTNTKTVKEDKTFESINKKSENDDIINSLPYETEEEFIPPFDDDNEPISQATDLPFDDLVFDEPETETKSGNILDSLPFDLDEDEDEQNSVPFNDSQQSTDIDSLPFDFDNDVDEEPFPFDDSLAPPENDTAVPFIDEEEKKKPANVSEDMKMWAKIVIECEKTCPPLIGQLIGSKATFSSNVLTITEYNNFLPTLLQMSDFTQKIEFAAKRITGREYKVKI